MCEFLTMLISTWWGILSLVFVSVVLWFFLSVVFYRIFFKRFYDIVLSGLAIILLSPILGILSVLVRIKLGSPIIFRQYRPGKNGKIFTMKKFRTMTSEKDSFGNLLADSQRMTKFGRFLRLTSLDELPEILNIFVGQMSIIGPRPQLVKDLVFMSEDTNRRHRVRGGLTGLAQVSGRNNLSWEQRFAYDLRYVQKISFFQDMKIFFQTILKVCKHSDVVTNGMVTSEDYGDYLLRTNQISNEEYTQKMTQANKMLSFVLCKGQGERL